MVASVATPDGSATKGSDAAGTDASTGSSPKFKRSAVSTVASSGGDDESSAVEFSRSWSSSSKTACAGFSGSVVVSKIDKSSSGSSAGASVATGSSATSSTLPIVASTRLSSKASAI